MGDFNGQIGTRRPGEETKLGPFIYRNKTRSRNGEKLINFTLENNLTILNSVFKKNKKKMWTWISPDGKTKNQIDYMITNRINCFTNFDVINKLNFNTNHRLIRAEIKSVQPKNPRPRQELSTSKLSKQQKEQLVLTLKDKFTELEEYAKIAGTQEKYDWIETTIKVQLEHINKIKHDPRNVLTTSTIKLLEQRNQLINTKDIKDRRKHIAKISKDINESIRKDSKRRRMEIIEKHVIKTGGVKKANKELTNSKDWIAKIKNDSGKYSHHRKNILKIATSHFRKIYEHNIAQDEDDLEETSNVPNILMSEVINAIDSQKRDKAPGPDGINNEILKESKEVIAPVLTDIFNEIIITEIIPQQWTDSNIILLYKKGDKYEIGNYRPISLMSNLYKIYAKILLNRIEKTLDEHQPIEQAGFRKDYSVLDHIHVVRQVMEKYKEYQLTYYIGFIDYSKAFDSLFHAKIWESLKEQGIDHKYIRLIKNVYNKSTARIQLEKKGECFKIGKGVRQGDPLSPKLFSAVLESIFRGLHWENLGINVDGRSLTHLRFADDIVLFAKTPEDLTKMINDLAIESKKGGLQLNPEKTRVMTNGERTVINLENDQIEYTEEYVYLGQLITNDNPMRKEAERRITNAWKRYWALKEIMKDKNLHINIKSKLFNTCILPVLMYGSQTWTLSQNMTNKLATCQHAMERSMMNVKKSDRLRNCVIRSKTKVTDITYKIRRLKWRWAGHMIRGRDKWSKNVTQWYPREGKRKRGRPQKKWDDDIRQVASVTWNRVAQDRREWKRLEEAFAEWQTDLQKIRKPQIKD